MNLKTLFSAFFIMAMSRAVAQMEVDPSWTLISDQTHYDSATDLYVTPNGESFVLGHIGQVAGFPNSSNLMLIKVSADGIEQWRKFIHPINENWELFAKTITTDGNGNMIVVFNENYKYTDYVSARIVVRKYDTDGNVIWSHYLTDDIYGRIEDVAAREAVIKNGNLYLVGSTYQDMFAEDSSSDGLILKIDCEDGSIVNKIIFDSEYHSDDMLREMRVSDGGEIHAIGKSRGYAGPGGIYSNYDALTAKFGVDGDLIWTVRHNGSGNSEDLGINLDVDGQGNVYTSSQIKIIGINQRQVNIHKISPSGQILWNHAYMGSSSGWNWDQPVEIMQNGNVAFVASGIDGITTKVLDPATGSVIWHSNYNRNSAGAVNHPRYMITDADSNIYITGTSRDTTPMGNGYDMVTLKYSQDGVPEWVSNFSYSDYETAGDDGVKLALDSQANVYGIGWTQDATNNMEYLLLKYGASLTVNDAVPADISIYPNPASDFVNLRLNNIDQVESVSITDISGRILQNYRRAEFSTQNQMKIPLGDLASAIYIIVVETQGGRVAYKFLKK